MLVNGLLYYVGRFILFGSVVMAGIFTGIKLNKKQEIKIRIRKDILFQVLSFDCVFYKIMNFGNIIYDTVT